MPNWKKVAISGSNISQFNNDGTYTKMNGNTSNGLLTFEATDCAAVESNITYDGSTQKLVNNGQINLYSGSYASGEEPATSATSALKITSLLSPAAALYTPTGSKNAVLSVSGRHSGFGSDSNCSATLAIISQVGNSNKNATVQLTSIGRQNGCHDAIFTIGVKQDAGSTNHPINEMLRMDGRDRDITFSGSLFAQPSFISTSGSLDNILVHDSVTGEIKTSTITPLSSNAVTSVNGLTGVVTLSIPTDNNQLANGAGYLTSAPVTSVNGNTGVVTTPDECVGTVCGEDISGVAANVVNVNTIEFQCASISTATNEATVKIHSATNTSNKAQIPFPDANNQLIGCSNIYICTSPGNGHQGSIWNRGGGFIALQENAGTLDLPTSTREAGRFYTWVGPATTPGDESNKAAPVYNIRPNTIGNYTTQNATSSLIVSTAQNTLNTTDNNNFSRIRIGHIDCNNTTFASTDLETISLGTNGSYCETTGFSVNVRSNDQLFYRRLYIESSDNSSTPEDANIILSGSLHVKTDQMATSSSLASVLVYDNNTGEIKKSSLTPSTSSAEAGGASGNVQYNSGTSCGFAAESSFTYNASTDKLTISNPGTGAGGLITNNIEGAGGTLSITDADQEQNIVIANYGSDKIFLEDGYTNIYEPIRTPNLATTTETDCPSVVISTTGELLEGPVGGAGQTPTLCQVTVEGNTTDQNIILDNGTTNCIKTKNSEQSGPGLPFILEGSDNKSNSGGSGGNISICAGDATGTSGGDGGNICLKAGTHSNVEKTDGCVLITSELLNACNGALAVGSISVSSTSGRIDAANDIVAYSTSDCRLKKYVKPIQNALDKIDQIRGVEFDWKVTDEKIKKEVHSFEGHDVGVIAQEIEAVLPEVVTTRDSGYKAVRYDKIVPLLIQGIKELKDEVEILKSKI